MNMSRKHVRHPLAINFKKLSKYDLQKVKLEEVAFFEWLIVKQKSFGENQYFYYQNKRTMVELGVGRTKLESLKAKMVDYGLIIEQRGILNTTHYLVSYDFLSNIIPDVVKKEFQSEFFEEIKTLNFKNADEIDEEDYALTLDLIDELDQLYYERCVAYNRLNPANKLTLGIQLNFDNKTIYQLNLLRHRHNQETIFNSFNAFIDALLYERDRTTHILNNFTSFDSHLNRFPVFGRYSLLQDEKTFF